MANTYNNFLNCMIFQVVLEALLLPITISLPYLNDQIRFQMDKGFYTGTVIIDLRKTFYTVDHDILLQELKALPVPLRNYRQGGSQLYTAAGILDLYGSPFTEVPPSCESATMLLCDLYTLPGGGPRVVVSTAAFHARVRGSVPGLGGLKETKKFLPHPHVKVSIVGSLRDREVACSASARHGSNFESCVWRTVSSQSSHYPQEVLLAQFSLYVHKGGLKRDSFHFLHPTSFLVHSFLLLSLYHSWWSETMALFVEFATFLYISK